MLRRFNDIRQKVFLPLSLLLLCVSSVANLVVLSQVQKTDTVADLRSFAATPRPTKKAGPCSQWCAACGGFCGDGKNKTCNQLAEAKCGEKPCYITGTCTSAPVATNPLVVNAAPTRAVVCAGESSKCTCDPTPVCNTVLRDSYKWSCIEYCKTYAPKPVVSLPPVVSVTYPATITSTVAIVRPTITGPKMGDRCHPSNDTCGTNLTCIATPYGYYCGSKSDTWHSVADGSECPTTYGCINACSSKTYYRNAQNQFICGSPPAIPSAPIAISISPTRTPTILRTPTIPRTPMVTITRAITATTTITPKITATLRPTLTVTAMVTATVPHAICTNPILPYAAVGELGGVILPQTYKPGDLVKANKVLPDVQLENANTEVSRQIVPALNCFAKKAEEEGYLLGVYDGGGFRDCAAQEAKNSVDCGHSEHQTGLAADLFVIEADLNVKDELKSVRHELSVDTTSEDGKNPRLQKLLNKAPDCGLVHPITYDNPHFFALGEVVDKKNWGNYDPIPKGSSNMEELNAVITRQQSQCK